ncbi:hypothetical protein [Archangium sp.]|uniref:hypothetical protein n=1 Tax=Archangium sp. TaxID=1872627 RepID=UPI002D4FE8FE|nr:hypothetical protein [Archangium sp.]HYO54805.1 hypothetical protein [Archangium sp.]
MRKPTWLDLGIAVLGLVLVCSAAQGVAQAPATEDSVEDVSQDSRITGTSDGMGSGQGLVTDDTPQETGTGGAGMAGAGTGQGTGTQQLSEEDAQQRVELARLRAEMARLEQQLAQMRAQLARVESATQGVGGSGTAGIGDPNAEAPGVGGGGNAGGDRPDTSNEGFAVANIIYTGRVRSVSQQQLVLVDDGGLVNTLSLAPKVRVLRGGQQVSLQSLRQGTLVRVSGDLYARGNPISEIQVLPPAEPGSGQQ